MPDLFSAVADPTRRKILDLLRARPRSSGELAEQFDLAWPTVSRHLAVLREAGLVTVERRGTSMHYELNMTVLDELVGMVFGWTDAGILKRRGKK